METVVRTNEWAPIEDLPANYREVSSPEFSALAAVWREQREMLRHAATLREFNERLQRQWAIETGIIERVYSLDRGVTQLLIERGIDASLIPHGATDKDPELVAQMIRDHKEAVEGLFDFVTGQRALSTSYIKELHAILARHQSTTSAVNMFGRQVEVPLVRGHYKTQPNNPTRPDGTVHQYCPPEHVAAETDQLIAMHLSHRDVPPEVEAAWLHHRFSQIHPFQDGNGRVARTLASIIFIKAAWFPLTVTRDDRERYIAALETADSGDLRPLVEIFAAIERRAFVGALSIAGEVRALHRVDQVIGSARDLLLRRKEALRREWERAKETAQALELSAEARFLEVARKLEEEVGAHSGDYRFFVNREPDEGGRGFWFRRQVIESAKKLGYFANTNVYRAWVRLVLQTDTRAEIVVSFHGVGSEYRGLLVASMFFFRREPTEEGEREVADISPVSDDVFQINYRESVASARERFAGWFEYSLVRALEIWRTGL